VQTTAGVPAGLITQWKLIRRMFAFMAPVKFHVAATAAIFICHSVVEITALYLLKEPVNRVTHMAATGGTEAPWPGLWTWLNTPDQGQELWHALLWLGLAKLILGLLAWGKHLAGTWQSMSMVYYMRAALYDRLQRVGFSFHDQYGTGEIINRSLNDLQNVRTFINQGLLGSLDIVFTMAGCLYLLLQGSPYMALAALATLPLWFWAIRNYAVRTRPIYAQQMIAADKTVAVLTENIAGVHVVRAFATDDLERAKFRAACEVLLERIMDGVRLQQFMLPLMRGIAGFTHILLFCLGALFVQQGMLGLGELIVFSSAIGMLQTNVQQINSIADAFQKAMVSSGRLFEVLDTPDSTPQASAPVPLPPGGGAVSFSGVSFSYESGKPVLQDVSFHVPAGSKVALVGPIGSGKTTLTGLLARFYDTDRGQIEIDGCDLRAVTLSTVREAVGYVFQENYLFSDTVARNIAYAELEAPLEKIKDAARSAHATEFIERLPYGYNTVIGEYGASLSGGQKQRLAIARALLHNPRILVMDDALSAVDPETEAQIRAELEKIMVGRTVFLITSRISTARHADQILVIENGQVTQRGTHAQLIRREGYYRTVALSQFAFAEDTASGTEASHMDRVLRASVRCGKRIVDDEL